MSILKPERHRPVLPATRRAAMADHTARVRAIGIRIAWPETSTLVLAAAITSLYAVLIGYFSWVDVYDRHFFEKEYSLVYNVARALFAVYLFWIVYFSGYLVLRRVSRDGVSLTLLERLPAGFFVGACTWTLGMLMLGYAYLYYRAVGFVLTVPIVALSCRHLAETHAELRDARVRFFRTASRPVAVLTAAAALAMFIAAALLFVVKGLYPDGGHDYFEHYFHYYSTVIYQHNIWPNNIWYHYFYSKGMGLFFLAMLLTDPLAPSLVTFCFAVAVSCALFSLVQSAGRGTLWPWIAVILFLAFYGYTPGTDIYRSNGGWGDFQKPHEVNAAFLVAILWMSTRIVASSGEARRMWWRACALCTFIVAFFLAISSGLVGLFMLLAAAAFFVSGRRQDAKAFFGLSVATGLGLVTVLVLNYATTGIPLDVGINWFWPIVDLRRVNEWGPILELTSIIYGRTLYWKTRIALFSHAMIPFGQNVFRYDTLWALFQYTLAAGVVLLAVVVIGRHTRMMRLGRMGSLSARRRELEGSTVRIFALVLLFVVAIAIFTVVAGASEPVSYVRCSSFALPILIAASLLVWQMMSAVVVGTGAVRWLLQYLLPVSIGAGALLQGFAAYAGSFGHVALTTMRFATGQYSIYDGYKDQYGWPGRMPWGAVHPGMLAAWNEVERRTRIRSLYAWSYCMLPYCRVERFQNSVISPHSPGVFFGPPAEARRILESESMNYFFISWDMEARDVLSCAPLLSVEHIAENLGVKWTDGTSYLLTWLGPGVTPLTPDWIAKYRAHIGAAAVSARCDENTLWLIYGRKVYEQVMQGKRWGAQISLPWK